MFYKRMLEDLLNQLEEKKNDVSVELSNSPEGCLLVYEKRGRRYYCQRLAKKGNRKKERRIGITKDNERLNSLVRKKYLEKVQGLIDKNIQSIDNVIAKYLPINEESVMADLINKYPELKEGLHQGFVSEEEWSMNSAEREEFFEQDLKSMSSQGERMRSGGEMYIASRLEHFGIPYKYEVPTGIPDIAYVPDFTIMRPRDRKIIYWEHFGKIDDNEYINDNIRKVSKYIEYGITPWDNLIMTYNNKRGGYDGRLIDAMIKGWLL